AGCGRLSLVPPDAAPGSACDNLGGPDGFPGTKAHRARLEEGRPITGTGTGERGGVTLACRRLDAHRGGDRPAGIPVRDLSRRPRGGVTSVSLAQQQLERPPGGTDAAPALSPGRPPE